MRPQEPGFPGSETRKVRRYVLSHVQTFGRSCHIA